METRASELSADQPLEPVNCESEKKLQEKKFNRVIPIEASYSISSFSSLSSWMKDDDPDMPDYDQFLDKTITGVVAEDQEKSMFGFPKGPQPGTCIHHIFEEIEFSSFDNSHNIIKELLSTHGIDEEWVGIVSEMLDIVVNKPLLDSHEELKLSNLQNADLVSEMEFYYQNTDMETQELLSIIRNEETITQKGGAAESGFLKGFIDLTFRFDGKFYLLDYKTNYLGDSVEDYQKEKLFHEMQEAFYDLQYHIYTIALHRFLKKRLTDYSYEDHFGGTFYLFLRGMNKNGNEGIYFDKPDWSVIQKLNAHISGGSHE